MFDTLKYSKDLEAVVISREHAEAHVRVIATIFEGDMATKQDVKDLKEELTKLEYRLVIKLGAMTAVIIGLAIGFLKVT